MVNRNPNPNLTSNTNGWAQSGGTLTATADGGRYVSASGTSRSVYLEFPGIAIGSAKNPVVAGLQIRRNTSASYMPNQIQLGGFAVTTFNGYSEAPVGQFVVYPRLTGATTSGTDYPAFFYLKFPDNVPIDITFKGVTIYVSTDGDIPASAAIDTSDAGWTKTLTSNSLTGSFKHNAANNECVQTLTWSWGDGTANTVNPKTNQASTVTHTYAAAGIYTVRLTASNFAGQSTFTEQTVSIPSGTYEAHFAHETDYLSVNVDASSSIAPSNSPVDTYAWNWGDGTSTAASASKYASHTYAAAGTYNVTLTIHTNSVNRTDTEVKSVLIVAPPDPDNYFVVSKKLLEAAFVPSIQDGTSYSWNFGDGEVSTVKEPVHVYAAPGTYTVSLTVNGTQTTSQAVTVTSVYTPLSSLSDALRLEVSIPHPAGTIYNRLSNPSGELGAFGWVTPVSNSYLVGSTTENTTGDKGVSGPKLIYRSSGTGTQTLYSETVKVTAGQYASAQMQSPYVDGYYRATVEALDVAGAVIGSSATTGFQQASPTATVRTTAYLLPAGTVSARLRVNHYLNTSSGVPAAGKILQLRRVMLATAATSGALTANPYIEGQSWQDLLGPTSEIKVTRSALDVGTLSATVLDSVFDPATSGTIRPGQQLRLRAATRDSAGNVSYQPLFTGTVNAADVAYVGQKSSAEPGPKATRITISASDAITTLAQTNGPDGVALISELPTILEGNRVPYEVNGSSSQVPTAQIVAVNDNASVLDQIAITRDTGAGYAYVDRSNVLKVLDPEHMPTVPVGIIDEEAYSDVDATFATELCMNSVTIVWLRLIPASDTEPAKVEEISYGPYEDADSIEEWGLRPAKFVMQGVENPTTIAAKAQAILDANSVPERRINVVQVPIRYQEDLHEGRALLDLYDLVQLGYERTSTNEQARITGITHKITPRRWTMDLEFSPDGAVATPQVVASPPSAAPAGSVSLQVTTANGATWITGWGQYDSGSNALVYTREGKVNCLSGVIRYTGAAATTISNSAIGNISGMPNVHLPVAGVNIYGATHVSGTGIRFIVLPTGALQLQKFPNGSYSHAVNEFFFVNATWIA